MHISVDLLLPEHLARTINLTLAKNMQVQHVHKRTLQRDCYEYLQYSLHLLNQIPPTDLQNKWIQCFIKYSCPERLWSETQNHMKRMVPDFSCLFLGGGLLISETASGVFSYKRHNPMIKKQILCNYILLNKQNK